MAGISDEPEIEVEEYEEIVGMGPDRPEKELRISERSQFKSPLVMNKSIL